LRNGEDLSIFFFNEINRARPQVHSLLLRLMAERSIIAFNREHRLPDLQVFADRNRIEKEETFELPAASRDRFFMEIAIETPKDDEIRRRLVFDTRFHDVDSLINEIPQNIVDYRELNGVARAIQDRVRSSEFLQHYVTALWRAVTEPVAAGIEVADVDMERLVLGGASPRGLSYLARAARVRAWLEGRDMIAPEDIRAVFRETMGHRIFLDPIYEMRRESIMPEFCRAVFAKVPAP
jgi:MoxR-like ATPase